MFHDRTDAGRRLGPLVAAQGLDDPVVLALPRGGVPVAHEVARALGAPLDVLVVRKIGAPSRPELGVGAIAEGGEPLFDEQLLAALGLDAARLAGIVAEEQAELARRVARYRGDRPPAEVAGRDVVVVDDGLATGVTARAALRAVALHAPRRLVLAVPVCAEQTVQRMAGEADAIVCVHSSASLGAVGQWYEDFAQVSDGTVTALLERAAHAGSGPRRE